MRVSLRDDWGIPYIVVRTAGAIASILDFIYLQDNQPKTIFVVLGLFLLFFGTYFRLKAINQLKNKAGFKTLAATGRLQIVDDHRLLKDGVFGYVRHPTYLGETIRNFGFILIFSSLYGGLIVVLATVILLIRIEVEEKMLSQEFGQEYIEYKRTTKKIFPYLY